MRAAYRAVLARVLPLRAPGLRLDTNTHAPMAKRRQDTLPAVRLPLSTGVDESSIDVYLPQVNIVESWKGNAILIVPGGAYNAPNYRWAKIHEGAHVARWIVSMGMMAVVLDYRLPQGRPWLPLSDALRAIETVRQEYSVAKSRTHHGKTWPIERVGVMGFSAGGHLAATAATLFTSEANRPDFAMLMCSRRLSTPPQHAASARHSSLAGTQ